MKTSRALLGRVATVTVAVAGVAGTLVAQAPPAQADNIDTWSSFTQSCGTYMCLFYSPGLTGGSWRPSGTADSDLNNNKFSNGQVVGNNAASMGNNTTNCNVTTWVYADYVGYSAADDNWLSPGHAGNLTTHLRNNERSINVNNCH